MSNQRKEKKYKITPKEYQKILTGVEIESISLINLKYDCKINELNSPVKLRLETDSKFIKQDKENVNITFSFNLKGKAKNKIVLTIAGDYNLGFSSEDKFTDEFHEVFVEYSLKLLMVPYLRDLFYNISLRSELNAIILPLMKLFPRRP